MQAILILITWPIPVKSQPEDPTWNYCGLITSAARLIGLHEPGREKEYGFPRATPHEIELRTKTWLQIFHRCITCVTQKCLMGVYFLIRNRYSSRVGVPPPLADEPTLRDITQINIDFDMPEEYAVQLRVLRKLAKFMQALQLQTDEAVRDSLILVSTSEFEMIRKTSRKKWTAATELQFLGAKLMVYAWSFQNQPINDPVTLAQTSIAEPGLSKKLILYEALGAATAYIYTFNELGSAKSATRYSSTSTDLPPQIYFPKYYFFTLYYADLTLYHFLSTLSQSSLPDQDLAHNHIRLAHTVLSRCAISNSQIEWARLAQNIELAGQFVNTGRRMPAEAQVKSRWGAKLFYDAMLKIAVLKAERGTRSYASDLTQGPVLEHDPDRSPSGRVKEPDPIAQAPNMNGGGGGSSGADSTYVYAAMPNQQQQPFMSQQWDENAFWGWDLSIMDTADFRLTGLGWRDGSHERRMGRFRTIKILCRL